MTYIVLDLEWNQPMSYHSSAYKSAGGKLIFEMIQIGAVKLDEKRQVVDTFSQLIQPTCYLKLHPRIRRITQIEQDALADAPQFPEALKIFEDWCGKDFALLTWGCDDISVLDQNLHYFNCQNNLGKIYDMQKLFGELVGERKDRKSLKAAMEHYEISPDDALAFHNAANDAYYTALVFQRFPEPEKVLEYPLTAKKLEHIDRQRKTQLAVFRAARGIPESLKSPAATMPPCPICGKKHPLSAGYLKMDEAKYTALSTCEDHGLIFVKLCFKKDENGKRVMERAVSLSEEQHKAYVSTKLLQWQSKLSRQEAQQEGASE